MKINLSPQRRDDTLLVIKTGDALTINGEVFDFSPLPEGATLPASAVNSPWITGEVTHRDGAIELTLLFPNGPHASEAARFPVALDVTTDGPVEFPE